MTEQPGDSPVDLPTKPTMHACEAVTWIAFRRAIPKARLGLLFKVVANSDASRPPIPI
jgi:hypothetical protein